LDINSFFSGNGVNTFEEAGIQITRSNRSTSNGDFKEFCPHCVSSKTGQPDKSLSVNLAKGTWNCFRCGFKGVLNGFVAAAAGSKKAKVYARPSGLLEIDLSPEQREWLHSRGITDEVIKRNKIQNRHRYLSDPEWWIAFPYFRGDTLINIKYRKHNEKQFAMETNCELMTYNINDVEPGKPLIWVEGEMDVLACHVAGLYNVVSPPNGGQTKMPFIDADIEKINQANEHVMALDNDGKGQLFERQLVGRLGKEKCKKVTWPDDCKDANDVLMKYGPEDLRERIEGADSYEFLEESQDEEESIQDLTQAAGLENFTDSGNARRMVNLFGGEIKYSKAGGWYIWDDQRWMQDELGLIYRLTQAMNRNIYKEPAVLSKKGTNLTIAWAKQSEAEAKINSTIKLARYQQEIATKFEDFDQNDWLINLGNGTVNLKDFTLCPHVPKNLITKILPLDYDPKATCPLWMAFLNKIMGGDTKMINFLARAVGYSMTGSTREQVFLILYGLGQNGKNTFVETIQALLGPYAMKTNTNTILLKKDTATNDIARLNGTRFVWASEIDVNKQLAESLLKEISGDRTITVRQLYKEPFEMTINFKLWLAVNDLPAIQGEDLGIWRRVLPVPFNVTIRDDEKDESYGQKLLNELPGIFNWALHGCKQWQSMGLAAPDPVMDLKAKYKQDSDTFSAWLAECTVRDDESWESSADLYQSYTRFMCGRKIISQNKFSEKMEARGFAKVRNSTGEKKRGWYGIRLIDDVYRNIRNSI
jgi:putative DNA primase/helicase